MHVTVYTNKYHNLIVVSTYPNFMHHGGNLKNNIQKKFVTYDGLCPNLASYCEVNAHMNDIIIQQNIILICKTLSHVCNSTKGLRTTTFNDIFSMKFYTYIKKKP